MGLSRRHGARSGAAAGVLADAQAVRADAALLPANADSYLRYYVLITVALAGLFSLQVLGLLDPLVIFIVCRRRSPAISRAPPRRSLFLSAISLVFWRSCCWLWQPRFWCRDLCPLGALIACLLRFSLLING